MSCLRAAPVCVCRSPWLNLGKALVLLITAVSLAGAGHIARAGEPEQWQRIDARGVFTFELPPDMALVYMGRGVDSFVGHFEGERCVLGFDSGFYGVAFYTEQAQPDFHEESTTIDDRAATVLSATVPDPEDGRSTFAAVRVLVREQSNPSGPFGRSLLTLWLRCTPDEGPAIAARVFGSIRFPS